MICTILSSATEEDQIHFAENLAEEEAFEIAKEKIDNII